jgi:hypothetical protein
MRLRKVVGAERQAGFRGERKMRTTRPSSAPPRAGFSDDTGAAADYIVADMARARLGADWRPRFGERAGRGGIERALL